MESSSFAFQPHPVPKKTHKSVTYTFSKAQVLSALGINSTPYDTISISIESFSPGANSGTVEVNVITQTKSLEEE